MFLCWAHTRRYRSQRRRPPPIRHPKAARSHSSALEKEENNARESISALAANKQTIAELDRRRNYPPQAFRDSASSRLSERASERLTNRSIAQSAAGLASLFALCGSLRLFARARTCRTCRAIKCVELAALLINLAEGAAAERASELPLLRRRTTRLARRLLFVFVAEVASAAVAAAAGD